MFFFQQFKKFDPKTGYVPACPFTYLPEIAYRARSLLEYRTPEQITLIAERVNSEIESYFSELKDDAISELKKKLDPYDEEYGRFFDWVGSTDHGQWLFKDDMTEELEIPTADNTSEVDALKTIIENRDSIFLFAKEEPDPDQNAYPEGKDSELFAVLALWLLADAINYPLKGTVSLSISGGYAIKAMDAVCYAEHLKETSWLYNYAKKNANTELTEALRRQKAEWQTRVSYWVNFEKERASKEKSEKSKQLNKIRHEKNYAAKNMVIEKWKKEPSAFPSAEKAGLHFADWLLTKGMKYEPRTVTNWIRDYAKQQGLKLR